MKKGIFLFIILFYIYSGTENSILKVDATTSLTHSINNAQDVKIPILMYHHLVRNGETSTEISPERFREHMKTIKNSGYTTITDKDLLDFLEGKKLLPKKPIMITFDDGYRSNYTNAYPVLKEMGMKATIFLITSKVVNEKNLYPNEIAKISWKEARSSQDVFSFQGHTHDSHFKGKNASKRSKGMITGRMFLENGKLESYISYRQRILKDLVTSKNLIEKNLGTEVISIAYPYGEYSEDTIQLAKKAGYKLGYSIKSGVVKRKDNPFTLNRIIGHGSLTGKELIEKIQKLEK